MGITLPLETQKLRQVSPETFDPTRYHWDDVKISGAKNAEGAIQASRTYSKWTPDAVYCLTSNRNCAGCETARYYQLNWRPTQGQAKCSMPESIQIMLTKYYS